MKIVQLTAENFKRLKTVQIAPDGNVVQITGRNAQGKSSCLDAIAAALGGLDNVCARPVRRGQDKAKIVCELDDVIVTRTFTAGGGSTLIVANKEGARFTKPQAVLDKLYGNLSFDPLAFSRMPAKAQTETLKSLVGLDFTQVDAKRAGLYADRTDANRELKARESQAARLVRHPDAPAVEESVAELAAEFSRRQGVNRENERLRAAVVRAKEAADRIDRERESIQATIAELTARLQAKGRELDAAERAHLLAREAAAQLSDADCAEVQARMAAAEGINRKVRENAEHAKLAASVESLKAKSMAITGGIDAIDGEKNAALAAAAFPIAGLSFDDAGPTFNGIPFDQASSAEQLRVSVAIGIALNPKLRVLLIRDGSLLDADSLRVIAEMAAANDSQFWIERVDDSRRMGVVIEDGSVLEHDADDDVDREAEDAYAEHTAVYGGK